MHEFGTRDVDATMRTMVRAALRQPHPDHDRRRRARRAQALLQVSLHPDHAQGHQADPDLAHHRRRHRGRRDAVLLHPRHRDRLDAAGRRSRPASTSRFRWSRSSSSAATSSTTSTSTGTRPRCWCRSACSSRTGCRWRASRRRGNWSTRTCRRTRSCRDGLRAQASRFDPEIRSLSLSLTPAHLLQPARLLRSRCGRCRIHRTGR